ncbi:tetratricopeptide repeat protein [Microbulbifer sediminum]|uniref:tetratricopeptide repeat protein n=1 Tax=Microbulbifer sediminum TaxID=2904250 RepID=UPI001F424592|nr:hypothetical protein [Microbulbifer sediminum]
MKATTQMLATALLICLSASEIAASTWRKYESDNFIVYSDYSEESVLKKIRRFEMFKATIHKLLSIPKSTEAVSFEIYLFQSEWTLRKFTRKNSIAGFYRDRLGYPLMVVGPSGKDEIFFHEYIHFLTNRMGHFVYPRWYSEGLADFYSTLEFSDGSAIIGGVPHSRRSALDYYAMLPVEHLLEPGELFKDGRYTARFYAAAWLLAHRMILGAANGMDDYSAPFKRYLLRYTKGERNADVLFEELGVDAKAVYNDLRRYAAKRKWNALSIPVSELKPEIDINELSLRDEINVKVRLAVAIGEWEYAGDLLREYEDSIDGEGRAALAIIEGHASEEVGQEEKLIERLIEAPSLSGAGHAYLGHALLDLAEKRVDSSEALLAEALKHLEIAREQEALYGASALMVEAYWALGRKQSAMNEIARILELNPVSLPANILAGEYSMKAGLKEDARFFLNRVVNWAHTDAQAKEAVDLLAELDASEP